ncbi:hypothetical protein CSKR_202031 [Clonorchis sinensis]|uniref:Uncharacterized protein n=1 Tax=Clonorchis sinensis TaxID=79923 RepID=A0A8T1MZC3_CLOSI|nr:hypothetical protein CSKR_202031 [Clonorchis sinensis]
MAILVMLFTFSLMKGFSTRRIPQYYQCLERCGPDPLDDGEASIKYDECLNKCVELALRHCIDQAEDEDAGMECIRKALKRCIANCVEDAGCIRLCKFFYS